MLTESREEFSDLHSIFRLCALRYSFYVAAYLQCLIFEANSPSPEGQPTW